MRLLLALPLVLALQQGKVPWEPTVEQALKTAEKTGRPVFLFFGCN
jgi:hypothetical protein